MSLKKVVELSDLRFRESLALRQFSDTFAKLYFKLTQIDVCYLYTKQVVEASRKLSEFAEGNEKRVFDEILKHANRIIELLNLLTEKERGVYGKK